MLTTLIAAALAAAAPAAPAPAGQTPDPHADHAKHGMTGALHGEMCKDCKSGEGAAKPDGKKDGCCCKDKSSKHLEQKGAGSTGA
ncbi:MAG: hypothetical protein ABIS39_04125 [Sphingomicrobium sp.]